MRGRTGTAASFAEPAHGGAAGCDDTHGAAVSQRSPGEHPTTAGKSRAAALVDGVSGCSPSCRCEDCEERAYWAAVEGIRLGAWLQRVTGGHPSDGCNCFACKENDRRDNASRYTGGMD